MVPQGGNTGLVGMLCYNIAILSYSLSLSSSEQEAVFQCLNEIVLSTSLIEVIELIETAGISAESAIQLISHWY